MSTSYLLRRKNCELKTYYGSLKSANERKPKGKKAYKCDSCEGWHLKKI